jgi:putative OPT family oligopeptide transporter
MTKKDSFKPFIPDDKKIPEFTFKAILLGTILAIVLGAANTYLGLYAGMTVSASIPAAVISMAILRGLLRKGTILENNIVQTIASCGQSVASGIIFTIPALIIVGAWSDFHFWQTTLMGICGVFLGVIFMIPLRRVLIIEEEELTYPEGVACGEVLIAGEKGGAQFKPILAGLIFGGVFKFIGSGLNMLKGTIEWATGFGGRPIYFGSDISMALVAVGYIVNFDIALLMFLGGFLGWSLAIPLLGVPVGMENAPMLDVAWKLWSEQVRYIGVGAMLVGGVWSIIAMRAGIMKGLSHVSKSFSPKDEAKIKRTEKDMGIISILVIFLVTLVMMVFLYNYLTQSLKMGIAATFIMAICSFAFVAVSSYMCGLIGSSNNPVSGMTICALLFTSALLLVLGFSGNSAIVSTLGIAGVVCVAACVGGDTSQDLKTGHIVGGTPKYQQIGMIIGGVTSAFFIPLVLSLLHKTYGIGTGLKAPQANLFASITKAIFGGGNMPKDMILIGVIGAAVCILIDTLYLKKIKSKFRIYVMPIAVGIYLPVTLAVPILIGGIVRLMINMKRFVDEAKDPGILYSSGLIAGESLMGIIVALFMFLKVNVSIGDHISSGLASMLSIVAIGLGSYLLWKTANDKK